MKICTTSFLLKNVLLHEKKPDIGNGVEHSGQIFCPEGSTRWPSTQYFRSILQVIYHELSLKERFLLGVSAKYSNGNANKVQDSSGNANKVFFKKPLPAISLCMEQGVH